MTVKRTRGRPQATSSDIKLLWYVRQRCERGMSIEQACAEGYAEGYLKPTGSTDDPVGALKKRFERTSKKYPDPQVERWPRPGEFGPHWAPIRIRSRLGLGAAILSVKRVKPVK